MVALGTPEAHTLRASGCGDGSHQPFVGGGCSSSLTFPYFREDPPGFEAKDYPMSKEELLSHVKKAVRMAACCGWG